MGYDQWLDAPMEQLFAECPDDKCMQCGKELPADAEEDDIAWEGFCSEKCEIAFNSKEDENE